MNRIFRLTFFTITITLYSAFAWSMAHSLGDIKDFKKKELSSMKSRYGTLGENGQLFTESQFQVIAEQNLAPLIKSLILHKKIKLEEPQDIIDFAQDIATSGLQFADLEPRILRYLDSGEQVFTALRKAIAREEFHEWRLSKIEEVAKEDGQFVSELKALGLSKSDEMRVVNVYATCIASFTNERDRLMMKPKICGTDDDYKKPRHVKYPVSVREVPDTDTNKHVRAYRQLIAAAQEVSKKHELDTFEKVVMAKCIAEQSLRFFVPAHHPLKALHKSRMLTSKSPEEAFFMHTGVCSNFSSIAYIAAKAVGLQDNIFLAKNGVHVYLEFQVEGNWYHSHPFNSKTRCDINRF